MLIAIAFVVGTSIGWFLGFDKGRQRERNRILRVGPSLRDLEQVFSCRLITKETIYFNGRWFEMPLALREDIREHYELHNPMKQPFSEEAFDEHFRR